MDHRFQHPEKGGGKQKVILAIIFLFYFFYIIFPDYFAIEFSESLPLVTASRILIIILTLIILVRDKGRIYLGNFDKNFYFFLAIMLMVNCINITSLPGESVKTILSLLLETWLFTYLIVRLITSEQKMNTAICGLVLASVLVSVLGVIEAVTGVNVFFFLTTTQRKMLQSVYIRFGAVRASGPFGHSIYFGTYQLCMLPFSLYLYDTRKKAVYFFAFILNIISVILSGSRGQMAVMFLAMAIILFRKRSKYRLKYIRNSLCLLPVVIILICIFPKVFARMFSLIGSVIQALAYSGGRANSQLGNANGILSRTEQLSGIVWTIMQGRVLSGFGNKAHLAHLIKYFRDGAWVKTSTFDVGYVAIFCQYGILGSIAFFKLYQSRLNRSVIWYRQMKKARSMKLQKLRLETFENLQNTFIIFYVCYLINLLTSTGIDKMLFAVIALQMVSIKLSKAVNE